MCYFERVLLECPSTVSDADLSKIKRYVASTFSRSAQIEVLNKETARSYYQFGNEFKYRGTIVDDHGSETRKTIWNPRGPFFEILDLYCSSEIQMVVFCEDSVTIASVFSDLSFPYGTGSVPYESCSVFGGGGKDSHLSVGGFLAGSEQISAWEVARLK